MDPPDARKKLHTVARALERRYGSRDDFQRDDPLAELVGTILSQNTSSVNCSRAYDAMRDAFPTWEAVRDAPRRKLEHVLRPAGLARTRSGRIQRLLRAVGRERGRLDLDHLRAMPDVEAERTLLQFEGVGPKTAKCVLLFALERDVFPIDAHIFRILKRLAVLPEAMNIATAHTYVHPLIPRGKHLSLHLNLIDHGRDTCRPTRPGCASCILLRHCPHGVQRIWDGG